MNILIVGHGVVGKNMKRLFPGADICDPPQCMEPRKDVVYDVAFVCVPTPMLPDGSCNTSIVEDAVRSNQARVFCIKSTVPPGTTDRLRAVMGRGCVFSPEFFGGTQHANGVDYDFVILGGERRDTAVVAEVYKERMTGALRIWQTDSRTAELVKYAENSFLAMKVTFFNEFHRLARTLGVDTNEFRELLLLDPRIGRSHSFVYEAHPYYQSHCLDKDIPAIIEAAQDAGYCMPLMRAVRDINDQWKHDEEERDVSTRMG